MKMNHFLYRHAPITPCSGNIKMQQIVPFTRKQDVFKSKRVLFPMSQKIIKISHLTESYEGEILQEKTAKGILITFNVRCDIPRTWVNVVNPNLPNTLNPRFLIDYWLILTHYSCKAVHIFWVNLQHLRGFLQVFYIGYSTHCDLKASCFLVI